MLDLGRGLVMSVAGTPRILDAPVNQGRMARALHGLKVNKDMQMPARKLPVVLLDAIREGRWRQPCDDVIRVLVPFDPLPFDFRLGVRQLEQKGLAGLLTSKETATQFHLYSSSRGDTSRPLPWLDVDRAIVIADGRVHGSDSAIALDLRCNPADPPVVASNWETSDSACQWQEVTPSLSRFLQWILELEERIC